MVFISGCSLNFVSEATCRSPKYTETCVFMFILWTTLENGLLAGHLLKPVNFLLFIFFEYWEWTTSYFANKGKTRLNRSL